MIKPFYISQGEDLDFNGQLQDFSGSPIDLTAIVYQLYIVIHDSYGTIVKKFASNNGVDIATWAPITITAANIGKFRIFLYSTETKPLKPGMYYIETRLKDTQALYGADDGALDVVEPNVYMFSLEKSVINNLL